ncbi:response regulator transcription factor [Halomonas sabkhae]|uniref:response regulator transcription factor n=1 Tax=Halomonas sabkhae TaxID=626223 RepID=UPI0025B29B3D|nr:response regulator transcription factor [Halomonas sabkhae]MDN3524480.1 response regulator transcription factor [Halomonas sabkhae]
MIPESGARQRPRVLVIDTAAFSTDPVTACLMALSWDVSVIDDASPLQHLAATRPDLLIVCRDGSGEGSAVTCQRLRREYAGPLLVLDGQPEASREVQSLEEGADDYVAHDVEPRVLVARAGSLLRRRSVAVSPPARLSFQGLEIDAMNREASSENGVLDLTSAEFDLLWLLASHAGSVVTREEIFGQLRGIKYDGQDRSIDVRVSRIRAKIGDDPHQPARIKTVRSRGYLFVQDP